MADLNPEKAYAFAQQLTTIEDCPRLDQAIEALAKDLTEICRSREEAEWLVHKARFTWKKWQGTVGLIELLEAHRRPSAPWPPPAPTLGPKPAVECSECEDFGTVYRDGLHAWCTCQQAETLRSEDPGLVEALNAKRIGAILSRPALAGCGKRASF